MLDSAGAFGQKICSHSSRQVDEVVGGWQDHEVCPISILISLYIGSKIRHVQASSPKRHLRLPFRYTRSRMLTSRLSRYKETTPYAIVNMSVAAKDMHEYINNHVFKAMEYWLNGKDAWVQETFNFARKYMTYAVSRTEIYL